MYCGQCGRQIENASRFCEFCGKEINQNHIQTHQQKGQENKEQQVFSHKSSTVAFLLLQIFLGIGLISFCIVMITNQSLYVRFDSQTKGGIIALFSIGIAIDAITLVVKLIKLPVVLGTVLNITNDGIFGTGGTENYLGKQYVNLKYSDIIRVSVERSTLIIQAQAQKYRFLLENSEQAAFEISKKLNG